MAAPKMARNEKMARAYDAIAGGYDLQVEGDLWMRRRLWNHYARIFQPGCRVLDVGCGTGIDAVHLARRGLRVVGIDLAPAMIDRLRAKAAAEGLSDRIEARVMDLDDLGSWQAAGFDGIVSSFAGLNGVPDLASFARDAARLLRPRGHLLVHLLNRFSLWEWLGLVRDGRWAEARRLDRQQERCFIIGGERVVHYLSTPDEAYLRFFAPYFLLLERYSLGSLRPPHTVRRMPRAAVELLGLLDRWLGPHRPFLHWGRFFVLDLGLRPEAKS